MRDGHFSKHLNRMRKLYRKKLEKLTTTLQAYAPIVQISGEQAGMHIVLTIDCQSTDLALVEQAKLADIRVYALSEYRQTPQNISAKPQVLVGFGGFQEEAIEPAVKALMNVWNIKKP